MSKNWVDWVDWIDEDDLDPEDADKAHRSRRSRIKDSRSEQDEKRFYEASQDSRGGSWSKRARGHASKPKGFKHRRKKHG